MNSSLSEYKPKSLTVAYGWIVDERTLIARTAMIKLRHAGTGRKPDGIDFITVELQPMRPTPEINMAAAQVDMRELSLYTEQRKTPAVS